MDLKNKCPESDKLDQEGSLSVDTKVLGEHVHRNSEGDALSRPDDVSLSNEVSRLKTRVIEEESKRLRLENDVKILTKKLEGLELALESQNLAKDTAANPTVYFVARLSTDLRFNGREVIRFDRVLVNIGGGYSATSGVFRVPVSGLYLITCSFSVNAKNNKARAYLKRNNHEIGRMKLECDVSRWCRDHGTLTQPMSLTNGDAIYVECEKSLEGDDLCTFSGVLLK